MAKHDVQSNAEKFVEEVLSKCGRQGKVSGVSTSGNYRVTASLGSGKYEIPYLPDIWDDHDVEYTIAQLYNFCYYIHSYRVGDRITAIFLTDLLNEIPKVERAAIFYRYGMDEDLSTVANKLGVARSTAGYHIKAGVAHIREILMKQ